MFMARGILSLAVGLLLKINTCASSAFRAEDTNNEPVAINLTCICQGFCDRRRDNYLRPNAIATRAIASSSSEHLRVVFNET